MKTKINSDRHGITGKGFKHLTPVPIALETIFANIDPEVLSSEAVKSEQALGRVLAHDVQSPMDIPRSDKSAMDGFAVMAEDTYGATSTAPLTLRLVGSANIGTIPNIRITRGEAASIVTGAYMPDGADAVVMVEYARQPRDGAVEISGEIHPGENVSRTGEDVTKNTVVLRKGTRILPQDIGMLVYLGLPEVQVYRKIRIGVLSTGNELQDGVTGEGKIPDVNRPILLNAIRELGCEPVDLGIAIDDSETIRRKLQRGLQETDLTLVTAGTSVGPEDNIPRIINSLGEPGMLVHGVAMRPSMPTGLACVNGKPIISLPGYPVSAYIAFLEFVRPVISQMLHTDLLPSPTVTANVSRRVTGILGSKTYVRVRVFENGEVTADPVRTSGAGILSSLVRANGFIIVPENVEGYEEGESVKVQLFRPCEHDHIDG